MAPVALPPPPSHHRSQKQPTTTARFTAPAATARGGTGRPSTTTTTTTIAPPRLAASSSSSSSFRPPSSSSSSSSSKTSDARAAFDRRNPRDKIRAGAAAPPTRTDAALLAMLDGRRTTTTTTKRRNVGPPTSKMTTSRAAGDDDGRKRRRANASDDDHDDDHVVLPPPPPPPRPASATTTARTAARVGGGRGGAGRGLDPPRGDGGDERRRRDDDADIVARGTGDGARIATDGGRTSSSIRHRPPSHSHRRSGAGGDEFVEGDDRRIRLPAGAVVGSSRLSSSGVVVARENGPADAAPADDGATAEGGDGDTTVTTMTTVTTSTTAPLSLLGIGGGRRNWSGRPSSSRGVSFRSSPSSRRGNFDSSRRPASSGVIDGCDYMTIANSSRGASSRTMDVATLDAIVVGVDAPQAGSGMHGHDEISTFREDDEIATEIAEWYDPEEFATMEKDAAELRNGAADIDGDSAAYAGGGGQETKSRIGGRGGHLGVNDNFVRLDLRNSAGSCRGARNLKKVNKHKLWRAQHRFGMNDHAPSGRADDATNSGIDDVDGDSGGMGGSIYQSKERSRYGSSTRDKGDGGDLKCFSSAKNAGVDPLDDFVDGVYSTKNGGRGYALSSHEGKKRESTPRTRDESVPMCARHQRPCKLLTVKRNNKGNKGRKFYVCCMPKGEQCDFFKWEEDTIEATQKALLESSSSSGFIARQVAAAKLRFKELTVPELRVEAKGRGIKATGKKNEILTRLLIWVRDEIANFVETSSPGQELSSVELTANADDIVDGNDDSVDDSDDENENTETTAYMTKLIELSDDENSTDSSSNGGDSDDCELEICHEVDEPMRQKRSTTHSASTLHDSLENYFGYTEFRDGQEWAIRRVLAHERTLLVAPTGQGKSLCYALPAALMDGICLVVSPLISLMQDQLRQLPPKIPAATLSGSMTIAKMALIVDDVMRGRYKVLFVSPERLASAAFRRLVRPTFNVETREYERQFPTVSLLCVDEAHCLSQWGHNFRPSYLRIRSMLPLIQPKSVLAITATAGPMVISDICNTLCIPFNGQCLDADGCSPPKKLDSGGVEVLNCDRDNIDVFPLLLQSNDERRYLLHKILKVKDKEQADAKKLPVEEGCLSKGSVIIYVWRQKDTEIVAEQLNGAGVRGGIVSYHGGMDSNSRSRAQSKFLRGKARICVATVAFGLGINKPDIEGVIHLCLPPSPEHYLQEIGRAGRDGRPSIAIALPLLDEFVSRHSLAHSDRLSSSQLNLIFRTLRKLVEEALSDIPPEAGVDLDAMELFIDDIHVAMPVTQIVDSSDCKEEWIETIFSLLEGESLSDLSLLSVEGYLPDVATVTLKKRSLDKLEKFDPLALSIAKCGTRMDGQSEHSNFGGTAMEKGFYAYSFGTYKFSVVRCARIMGPQTEPRHVYAALRRLQDKGELELTLDTTPNGRALHLRMRQAGLNLFRGTERNGSVCQGLVAKLSTQFSAKEAVTVGKVESMYEIIHHVSRASNHAEESITIDVEDDITNKSDLAKKSPRLVTFQKMVQHYFRKPPSEQSASRKAPAVIKDFPLHDKRMLSCLTSDVGVLMQMLALRRQEQMPMAVRINDPNFNDYRDLCLAKILHSIDSPRAPILEWYSHPLWGKYRSYSFSSVVQAVKQTFDNS